MTKYQYLPNFEPFLVKYTHEDFPSHIAEGKVGHSIGLQAINVLEGDVFNWSMSNGTTFIPLSAAFGTASQNVHHFILESETTVSLMVGGSFLFRLSVIRDDQQYTEEKVVVVIGTNGTGYAKDEWTMFVNGNQHHAITEGGNTKRTLAELGIDLTPYSISSMTPTSQAQKIKSEGMIMIETLVGQI